MNTANSKIHPNSRVAKLLALCVFALAGCGNDGVDCGSAATRELIVQIVQENPDKSFGPDNAFFGSFGVGSSAVNNSTAMKSVLASKGNRVDAVCCDKGGCRAATCNPDDDAEYRRLLGEQHQIWDRGRRETSFSVDTIRMSSRNADTAAVSCSANLNAKFEDGQAHKEIEYKVEKTTDGKLFATIHGM